MSGRDFSDKFGRITMPAEGFVTVVPVDKMTSRKVPASGNRTGDWSLRDPSPSTARLRCVLAEGSVRS